MAGSTWPALTAGNRARASDVVSRFQWLEGSLVPMTGGSSTDNAFDLGSTTSRWANLYLGTRLYVGTTTSMTTTGQNVLATVMIGNNTSPALNIGGSSGDCVTRLYLNGDSRPYGVIDCYPLNSGGAISFAGMNTSGTAPVTMAIDGMNQGVVIGATTTVNANALLELAGTKALILPRLSTTQRNALTAAEGMAIYNSTLSQFQAYENGAWVRMIGAAIGVQPPANTTLTWTVGTTSTNNLLSYTGSGRIRNLTVVFSGINGVGVNIVADGNTIASVPVGTFTSTATAYKFQIPTTTGFMWGFSTTAETSASNLDLYFKSTLVVEGKINATQSGTAQLIMGWEHQ